MIKNFFPLWCRQEEFKTRKKYFRHERIKRRTTKILLNDAQGQGLSNTHKYSRFILFFFLISEYWYSRTKPGSIELKKCVYVKSLVFIKNCGCWLMFFWFCHSILSDNEITLMLIKTNTNWLLPHAWHLRLNILHEKFLVWKIIFLRILWNVCRFGSFLIQ